MSAIAGTGGVSGRMAALQAEAQASAGSTDAYAAADALAQQGGASATPEQTASAVASILRLPAGYRAATGTSSPDQGAQTIAANVESNAPAMQQVSSAGHDGMGAARELGTTSETAFMSAHPNVAARYANDPAFKAGFDAYSWAEQHSPTDVSAMNTRLDLAAAQQAVEMTVGTAEMNARATQPSMMAMMQRA